MSTHSLGQYLAHDPLTEQEKIAVLAGICVAVDQVADDASMIAIAKVFNLLIATWGIDRPASKTLHAEVMKLLAGTDRGAGI